MTDNQGATGSTTRTVTVSTPNLPPTAAFQFLPTGGPAPLFVFFDGSSSTDPDGAIADYTWDFGDGTEVVGGKTPAHTFATAGTFTVRLTVQDTQGATASTTQSITVTAGAGGGAGPTISGRITYARVPLSSTNSLGLNYSNTNEQPAREVIVELIPAGGGAPLATTTTDSDGNYAFTSPANTNVFVRARAQARRTTSPTLDIRVLNNTGGNALYVLDGSVFNTGAGAGTLTRNLAAGSGWGGTGYVGVRAAAPFAILDTLYAAAEFVHDNGASVDLPALDAFWSPLNNPNNGNVASGNIVSTLYRPAPVAAGDPPKGIYVLGLENVDTDEYDPHVLAHEFQHYLEDNLSRTDTTGGEHATNERLDLRLAFSEGFANAFSGMVLNNPVYRDTRVRSRGRASSSTWRATPRRRQAGSTRARSSRSRGTCSTARPTRPMRCRWGTDRCSEAFAGPLLTGAPLTSIYPFLTYIRSQPGVAGADVAAART